MMRFLRPGLAALALAFAAPVQAQALKDADPALWVVEDADTRIYLFGTIHVLKPGLSWFDEAVWAAYNQSDEIMLEMIEPDEATMAGMIMKLAITPTGPTLTEKLPADKREAYTRALTDLGIPAAALDRFDPWFAAVTLTVAGLPKLGYDPESGAERTLSTAAKAAGKKLGGLETAEQQLGFFDALPEPLQLQFLVSTIDDLPKMGTEIDKMVTSWATGDPDSLAATLNESMRETPEIGKVLLSDRNARWAEWIDQRMRTPGNVFIAVGAGHLAGRDSVQAWLAKRKLTAKRIRY
ncbi:TraB/GumN family protein [Sphingomonas psychrotolerans]|uniref:TraB/GumN family protein n=1 Tax=Sphingomonas psychrotolerans TaxID=1327635 RepID=A0A2K8MP92_9SPHN|nr:TraB/GumN family protein [Sphingomonas psychrotolerans]ATY33221.1 TraB/GumN family protein [Sphingomonas psychrotolerans]